MPCEAAPVSAGRCIRGRGAELADQNRHETDIDPPGQYAYRAKPSPTIRNTPAPGTLLREHPEHGTRTPS